MRNPILIINQEAGQMLCEPSPECYDIKEFAAIIKRADTLELARKELAYVYHMVDAASPYASQGSDEEREKRVIDQVMPEGWKPDKIVWLATKRYKDLKKGPMEELLDSSMTALHKVKDFLSRVNFDPLSGDEENPAMGVKDLKDIMAVMRDMPKTAQALQDLAEQVEREKSSAVRTKGQIEVDPVFN